MEGEVSIQYPPCLWKSWKIMDFCFNLTKGGPGPVVGQESQCRNCILQDNLCELQESIAGTRNPRIQTCYTNSSSNSFFQAHPIHTRSKLLLVRTTLWCFHFWNAEVLFSSRISLKRKGNSASSQNPLIHSPKWVLRDPQKLTTKIPLFIY